MDRAVAWILMVSALTVLSGDVESKQRVCYFGPPPEPDPDNPDDWMKQVMREIRERCPGERRTTPVGHTVKARTTVGHTTITAGKTTMGEQFTTAGRATTGKAPTPTTDNNSTASQTTGCLSPERLGLEDGTIPDSRIKASDSANCCPAEGGRLNLEDGGWEPQTFVNSWIEVDLVESTNVSGVLTQGFNRWYVTQYKVAYRREPSSDYVHVTDGNGYVKVFTGNTDGGTLVTNLFNESVVATVVRIEPTAWNGAINLRFELLGCLP